MGALPNLIAIVGPTASGKTDLSCDIAKHVHGEIINADSTQVYTGMDIGTAKISLSKGESGFLEYRKIPHHLFNIVTPDKQFSAAQYQEKAFTMIDELIARDTLPILVGGTGLYIKAVIDNYQFPKAAPEDIRNKLNTKSLDELKQILYDLDPTAAAHIDMNNPVRIIRAIEIIQFTKKPIHEAKGKGTPKYRVLQIGVSCESDELKQRITDRVYKQLTQGLEKEVHTLADLYGWESALSSTIAYQEWQGFFTGTKSREAVVEEIISDNMKYAKRQMTWFKSDERIRWLKQGRSPISYIEK